MGFSLTKGQFPSGTPNNPYLPKPGVGPSINPTVKKARVYDARTGEMIQEAGNFSPEEIAQGAGTFPGGLHMQEGTGNMGGGYGGHGRSSGFAGSQERFGNPGGVMAPPSPNALEANGRSGMGSLDDFYSMNKTNPVTGLAYHPVGNAVDQKRSELQQGGNLSALKAFDIYNQNRDPFTNMAAIDAMKRFGYKAKSNPQIPQSTESQMGPLGGMADFALKGLGFRAKGGSVGGMNPYLVGEKGMELAKYKDGTMEPVGVNGPEVRMFSKPGTIIPHDKIKARAGGGRVTPSDLGERAGISDLHQSDDGIIQNFKRNFGQSMLGREFGLGNWANEVPVSHRYQDHGIFGSTPRYDMPPTLGLYTGNTGPVASVNKQGSPPLSPTGPNTPDFYWKNPILNAPEESENPFRFYRNPLYNPMTPLEPLMNAETDDSNPESTPFQFTPQEIQNAKTLALARASASGARDRMTSIPNVRTLSKPLSTEQSFLTPYGKASVSFGQPKNPFMADGLDKDEFLKRAEIRQADQDKTGKQYMANERALKLGIPLRKI